MSEPRKVDFGWGAEPLWKQLPELDAHTVDHFQQDAAALMRLSLRSLLPPGERDRAARRLANSIDAALKLAAKAKEETNGR